MIYQNLMTRLSPVSHLLTQRVHLPGVPRPPWTKLPYRSIVINPCVNLSGGGINQLQWNYGELPDRSIVRIMGEEAAPFLQGLMTNDINLVVDGDRDSIYCAFLNTSGRILFDSIISRGHKDDEWLLDVDSRAVSLVTRHLSMYKIRRKITIKVADDLSVYSVYISEDEKSPDHQRSTQTPLPGSTFCDGGDGPGMTRSPSDFSHPDPRLVHLGHRLVMDKDQDPLTQLPTGSVSQCPDNFTQLRCRLGVSEGVTETPTGKCFPLEYNLDYLHGVSFHKGCYLGQELTARTHHTGVIRKRILPFQLEKEIEDQGEEELSMENEKGKSVGKVRLLSGIRGLGLLRIKETFLADKLTVKGVGVEVSKPLWWPPEKDEYNKILYFT